MPQDPAHSPAADPLGRPTRLASPTAVAAPRTATPRPAGAARARALPAPIVSAAIVLATALLATPPLSAQTPDTVAMGDTLDAVPVEPVTVTVLREATLSALTPYAVAGADAERLRLGKTGAFLEEALSGLPGVQVQNRYNYAVGERLAVRGFGPRAQFGVRGVKVLIDGIPATMPDGQSTLDHLDLASVGSVELLRGPGSALYGNAAGGVLVFRTEAPAPGPLRPRSRVVGGSHGLVNATGGVEGWIGGSGVRVDVSRLSYDGFRADPSRAGDATYGATDRWLLNGQLRTELGGGALRVTLNGVTFDAENPGSLPRELLDDPSRPARGFNVSQRTGKEVDQLQLGAVWEGTLAGRRAEVAAWGLGRDLVNPIPPAVIDLSRRAGGVRLIAGSGTVADAGAPPSWTAGVEAEALRDDRRNFENDGGARGARTLDQEERVRALGAFVRAGAPLGGRVRLSAALRYDHFDFEADDRFTLGGDPDDSGERTMEAWSPTAGVVVEAVPGRAVLWGNVSTALETPTTTELVNRPGGAGGFNPGLDPQRSTTLEAGLRGSLARLAYELVWFRTDLDDELVPFEVVDAPGRSFFRNAGASEHEGVEASLEVQLPAGVVGRAVYSRVDGRFERFEVDGEDLSGNRIPGLAPNRFHGTVEQTRPGFFWEVETEWTDAVPVDDANSESTGSYWLVNLRGGLRGVRTAGLVLAPFAGLSNLFDERYTASVAVNAFGGRFYEPGPGRTGYAGLRVAWER